MLGQIERISRRLCSGVARCNRGEIQNGNRDIAKRFGRCMIKMGSVIWNDLLIRALHGKLLYREKTTV